MHTVSVAGGNIGGRINQGLDIGDKGEGIVAIISDFPIRMTG
jgi:hypothetical protein